MSRLPDSLFHNIRSNIYINLLCIFSVYALEVIGMNIGSGRINAYVFHNYVRVGGNKISHFYLPNLFWNTL